MNESVLPEIGAVPVQEKRRTILRKRFFGFLWSTELCVLLFKIDFFATRTNMCAFLVALQRTTSYQTTLPVYLFLLFKKQKQNTCNLNPSTYRYKRYWTPKITRV